MSVVINSSALVASVAALFTLSQYFLHQNRYSAAQRERNDAAEKETKRLWATVFPGM